MILPIYISGERFFYFPMGDVKLGKRVSRVIIRTARCKLDASRAGFVASWRMPSQRCTGTIF